MTFREIEQFVVGGRSVLFVVDNFRLHRFFALKKTTKNVFLCFLFTDMNSFKSAIDFQVFCIPGSLLRPPDVRIFNETTLKSACC